MFPRGCSGNEVTHSARRGDSRGGHVAGVWRRGTELLPTGPSSHLKVGRGTLWMCSGPARSQFPPGNVCRVTAGHTWPRQSRSCWGPGWLRLPSSAPPPDLALAWHSPRSFSLSTRRHLPNVLATPPGANTSGHPVKLRTGKRGHAAAESHAAEFC